MQAEAITAVKPTRDGTLILDGYGIQVSVYRRHLVVSDGVGRQRRSGRFARATAQLKRLIILGHSGAVTLEALRWLSDVGVSVTQIDLDGRVVLATGVRRLNDAKLRRAAALAAGTETGAAVGRWIVSRKLDGQEALLLKRFGMSDQATTAFARARAELEAATTARDLLRVEALAAGAYWAQWDDVPVRFVERDRSRVPDHWLTFSGRASPLTGTSRRAGNPANAMLNYLYAMLEAESAIALSALGFDPGIGIVHADQVARASMACDVMEVVRPGADGFLLDYLSKRHFAAKQFVEQPDGTCRVGADVARELAATAGYWSNAVAPLIEGMASLLLGDSSTLPKLLTAERRIAGQNLYRQSSHTEPSIRIRADRTCALCGEPTKPTAIHCSTCQLERRVISLQRLASSGTAARAEVRSEGSLVTDWGREALARHLRATKAGVERWDTEHDSVDTEVYWHEIYPSLRDVPVRQLSKKAGLSISYCSSIRRGSVVPHARHWSKLAPIPREF